MSTKLNGKLYCHTAYTKGATTPGTAYKIYKVTMGGLYIKDDNGAKLLLARNGGIHDWRKFFSDNPGALIEPKAKTEKAVIPTRKEWFQQRIEQIGGEISRIVSHGQPIPSEYVQEYNDLIVSK